MSEVIVALDTPSSESALQLVDRLGEAAGYYKVGLELFTSAGPAIVSELKARDKRVFLDLKLHDIPNTVARAVRAACDLDVDLLTVHACGGQLMLDAACESVEGDLQLLAVTILTSLGPEDLSIIWKRRVDDASDEVLRLAHSAQESGVHGVVASAWEVARIRVQLGSDFLIAAPGIRPKGTDRGDQKRVASPAEAVESGADFLVVGRPVTQAPDPSAALAVIRDEMDALPGSHG